MDVAIVMSLGGEVARAPEEVGWWLAYGAGLGMEPDVLPGTVVCTGAGAGVELVCAGAGAGVELELNAFSIASVI